MAENRVEREDLSVDDPFKNIRESAEQTTPTIQVLEQSLELVVQSAKIISTSLSKVKPVDTKSISDLEALQQKSNQTLQSKLNIDREIQKETQKLKVEQQALNKELREEIKVEKEGLGTLEKVSKRSKELRDRKQKLNLETKNGRTELRKINAELNRNNKFIERNSTALGKQKMNIGNYKSAISGLRGALGKLGIAFGVFSLVKGAFNTILEFQQGQADLASVLGTTAKGITNLTEQAKKLGATTTFTATEVLGLQKEFAKLGFLPKQIQQVTESTLLLTEATGTELARAAEVTGATIRGFGLATTETQRVVDVMAKSFSSSSLDMEKFANSMSAVAPIATQMGYSLEATTALIGTLTDRGIDASTAGTGLRNMFLDAQKAGMTLDEALKEINGSSDKIGKAFDLFGKRGATLGVILAENGESVATLEAKLMDAEGASKAMAETQRATLGGSLKLLSSAWDGYVLSLDEAGGIGEKLRWGIQKLGENLEVIIGWVIKAIKWWAIYKATLMALKMRDKIIEFRDFQKAVKSGAQTAQNASAGIKAFGQALKGIGLSFAIGLLVEFAQAFWDVASGAKRARIEAELFAKATAVGAEKAQTFIDQQNTALDDQLNKIRILRSEGKISETEALKRQKKAIDQTKQSFDLGIKDAKTKKKNLYEEIQNQKLLVKELEDNYTVWAQMTDVTFEQTFELGQQQNALARLRAEYRLQQATIDTLTTAQTEAIQKQVDLTIEINDDTRATKENTKKKKEASTELKNYIDLLQELNDNMRESEALNQALSQIRRDQEIKDLNELIKLKQEENNIAIEKTGFGDTTEIEALINARTNLELDAIDERALYQIQTDKDEFAQRFSEMRKQAKQDRDELLKQDNLTDAQRKIIKEKYKKEIEKINAIELDAQQNLDAQILNTQEQANNDKLNAIRNSENEITDIKKENIDKVAEYQKKKDEEAKEREKENAEKRKEIIKALTDYVIRSIDERIDKIDQEISEHEKQRDIFEQMAVNGNITAKESLAEQNRLIAEANAKKEQEEKRKQRVLLVSAILESYNAELATGANSTEAFTKAVTSTTLLNAFVQTLPTFLEGVEDTGTHGKGVDGKGGFHAILHPNERVLTKEQNAKIGSLSNEFVAQKMEDIRMGKLVEGASSSPGWENALLVNQLLRVEDKLDQVNSTILNRPVNNWEIGNVLRESFSLINKQKTKHGTTTNVHKIKMP